MKEREFSKELRRALRKAGFVVWPIETGSTGVGVPDLFVVGNGAATFIEVKSRMNQTVDKAADDSALLRPGQKQFAREFASGTRSQQFPMGLRSLVAVCCKDGLLFQSVGEDGERLVVAQCLWEERGLKVPSWLGSVIVSGYLGEAMPSPVKNYIIIGKEDA